MLWHFYRSLLFIANFNHETLLFIILTHPPSIIQKPKQYIYIIKNINLPHVDFGHPPEKTDISTRLSKGIEKLFRISKRIHKQIFSSKCHIIQGLME